MASDKETPSTTVTVDMAQLAALIAATVKQTLDSQRGNATDDNLGQTIGQAVADGMAKHTRPKVPYGTYIKRVHSSMHPDPKFPDGPPLDKDIWINGLFQPKHQLTDAEIYLFNRLSRSGRYVDRLVEVVVGKDGVEIRYNDSSNDQRNENAGKWRTTVEMLELIVTAMDAENAEEREAYEEKVAKKASRSFGGSAYKEAKEKNG
jgi:hypothetical protein